MHPEVTRGFHGSRDCVRNIVQLEIEPTLAPVDKTARTISGPSAV